MSSFKVALCGFFAALAMTVPAHAASLLFQFDVPGSSISVTDNTRSCFPGGGCALSATKVLPGGIYAIEEGAANAQSFNFASFNVSPGFGGDSNARVNAVLAFTQPAGGPVGTGGTASYLRLGGFFTPGLVVGSLIWDDPIQHIVTANGSKFTVEFGNLQGVTFGSTAVAPVKITVDSVSAVPEPATWAMLIIGFAAVGVALRSGRGRSLLAA